MQMTLALPPCLPSNAYEYGTRASGEVHGVVLTKPHVVELILDMAGYTADRDLPGLRLLEPSCGQGAFLVPALRRLLASAERAGRSPSTLDDCILAFDIDAEHVQVTRDALHRLLREHGVSEAVGEHLVTSWVRTGDFLLAPLTRGFDVVVGNPPYVRIEQLSERLHAEYRSRYRSLYDRADLYVAFIERGLSLLAPSGMCSFICADRWVGNRYGAPLRRLISDAYGLRCYIDLHQASPFESEVIAYPSIFVMTPGRTKAVDVITLRTGSAAECAAVSAAICGGAAAPSEGVTITRHETWFQGEEPWVITSPRQLATLRELESRFLPLESTARVGIGVATGNDGLYIVGRDADIEPERLVALVMRDDIQKGRILDGGHFVINAFEEGGAVVDLDRYPRLQKYLATHEAQIRKRHVARKNPRSWFRTIDRVHPWLVSTPKLLIPDIAGSNEVAFDVGEYHPHHNLYFVTSDQWDMEVLGGLLSSKAALFFVWSYASKMRGGYLRFQAQYLRRIRLPDPLTLSAELSRAISAAFQKREFSRLDELALQAYGLGELPPFDFVDTRR